MSGLNKKVDANLPDMHYILVRRPRFLGCSRYWDVLLLCIFYQITAPLKAVEEFWETPWCYDLRKILLIGPCTRDFRLQPQKCRSVAATISTYCELSAGYEKCLRSST